MLLFAGHDPGSLNHVRPILELAQSQGREVMLVELRPKDGAVWGGLDEAVRILDAIITSQGDSLIEACITGISTNKAELDLFQACNARHIFTAAVIDFAPGHRLQTSTPTTAFPALFLMTNANAVAEVTGVYGVAAEAVVLGGSTSLEQLAADTAAAAVSSHALRLALGLPPDTPLVPFFLAPDDMVPSATEGILSCVRALATWLPLRFSVAVRPHPRNAVATVHAGAASAVRGRRLERARAAPAGDGRGEPGGQQVAGPRVRVHAEHGQHGVGRVHGVGDAFRVLPDGLGPHAHRGHHAHAAGPTHRLVPQARRLPGGTHVRRLGNALGRERERGGGRQVRCGALPGRDGKMLARD